MLLSLTLVRYALDVFFCLGTSAGYCPSSYHNFPVCDTSGLKNRGFGEIKNSAELEGVDEGAVEEEVLWVGIWGFGVCDYVLNRGWFQFSGYFLY